MIVGMILTITQSHNHTITQSHNHTITQSHNHTITQFLQSFQNHFFIPFAVY